MHAVVFLVVLNWDMFSRVAIKNGTTFCHQEYANLQGGWDIFLQV
jgi:hypothetical protein